LPLGSSFGFSQELESWYWPLTMPFYNTVLQVMTVGGTKPSYNVDIYSGNHPFYQGGKTNAVMDEGMVRF